jgi:peptide/nickel transport system permease protein
VPGLLIFTARRLVTTIPTVLIVAIIAFILIRLAPGDPALAFVTPAASQQEIEEVRRQLGLDQPLAIQFVFWFGNILRGDLGHSFFLGRDVTVAIAERLPATLQLTGLALLFALIVGILAGVIAALNHNRIADRLVMIFTMVGVSVPVFWLGLLLMWFFAVQLRWFPTGGFIPIWEDFLGGLRSTTLPAVALGTLHATLIARITRTSMLEYLHKDFVRTARAKGISEITVTFKHVLRNAMIPVVTVVGVTLGALLSGAVIIETVFTYPGIGRLVVRAVQQRDYNLVQGVLLVVAGIYVFINFLVDLSYAYFDPRIRYT